MKLAIIVAQSQNRVIGSENDLPWRLPKDLQYFKKVTLGKPIIMGRKTYESIGRPLPGRTNIVITRNESFNAQGIEVVTSLEAAYALAADICEMKDIEEAMIIGGAQIYQQALTLADTLYITQVAAQVDGDAFFPEIDYSQYVEIERQDHQHDENNPFDYSFVTYKKISK